MKRTIISVISLIFCIALVCSSGCFNAKADNSKTAKNVIIMIGDGMGPNQVNMAHDRKGSNLNMEEMPFRGTSSTANSDGDTTDSAAGATAISCGVKVKNGYVGMTASGRTLPNIREFMAERGRKTGIITTSYVVDATPAAFGAHTKSRSNKSDIAQQLIKNEIDVIMGGGIDNFSEELLNTAQLKKGYTLVRKRKEMLETECFGLLGLFSEGSFPYYYGSVTNVPTISEMTNKAINILKKNAGGFFLMVEGGKIDHAATAGSLERCVSETLEFDKAVKVVCDFAISDGNTLVVVTADHETGGLQIVGDSYQFTTNGSHTSADVPVFAIGVGASNFTGTMVNTDINKKIKKIVDPSYVEENKQSDDSSSRGYYIDETIGSNKKTDKEESKTSNNSKNVSSANNSSGAQSEKTQDSSKIKTAEEQLSDVEPIIEYNVSNNKKSNTKTIIIIVLCAFAVLMGVEIFFIIKFKNKKKNLDGDINADDTPEQEK